VDAGVITPADLAGEGHAALHVAMELAAWAEIATPIIALADALSTYEEIDADALRWETVWPHLSGEADPDDAALRKAAEDVASATETLIAALAGMTGSEDLKDAVAGVKS
jgi:hypothetical protein